MLTADFIIHHNLRADVFVETGTGNGVTLGRMVASNLFKELHSIDISEERVKRVSKAFQANGEVVLHHGQSPAILSVILPRLASWQTTFWLDAHWGGDGEPTTPQCPLLAELKAIMGVPWKVKPFILIDDAQYFSTWFWSKGKSKSYDRKQWPTMEEIWAMLPGYGFEQSGRIIVAKSVIS